VVVEVDSMNATDTVYAMLHVDNGEIGVFEFPDGPDGPVTVNDQVVIKAFAIQGTPVEAENSSVDIRDSSYGPSALTIPQGTTVVWTNSGSYPHTVTADDNTFDSGKMVQGDSFSFSFEEPGEYPYHCVYHGGPGGNGMSAVIIVTEN
jgi:plastocyanin